MISGIPPHQASAFFYAVILSSALSSAAAIYVVEGDSRFTPTYYLGLLLTLSGVIHYPVSAGSETLFGIFTKFEEGFTQLLSET